MSKLTRPSSLLALNAYFSANAFKWNIIHPLVLPALLLGFIPGDRKNTVLGLLTFLGLALAALIQPLSGALSDQWRSSWGRRRPLMALGALLEIFFLWMIASVPVSAAAPSRKLIILFGGYIGLQLASNLTQGPAQGLLPDCVADGKLGLASGLKNMLEMLGLVAAALIGGHWLAADGHNAGRILLWLIPVSWGLLLITFLAAHEVPRIQPRRPIRWRALWQHTFHLDKNLRNGFGWLIIQRFFFLLGIYGLQAFIQYYLQDVLQSANPVRETGNLLAALTLALTVLAALGGWLSDRRGAPSVLRLAGSLSALGYILSMLASSPRQLILYSVVLGAGVGLFISSNWALANQLAPQHDAGRYLGLTNLATAGAAALARLMGPGVDFFNHLAPHLFLGYRLLFLCGTAGALLSLWALKHIPKTSSYPL